MKEARSERLVVVHSHLRPGGVRRVIELALPGLVRAGRVRRVTLLVGEGGAEHWVAGLRVAMGEAGAEMRVVVDRRCGYFSEGRERVGGGEGEVGAGDIVWAHNLGLGQNWWLAREVVRWAEAGALVVSQHHDFWFENRWGRWDELRAAGAGSLAAVGDVIFSRELRHVVINGLDSRGLEGAVVWPNPVASSSHCAEARTGEMTRAWLRERWGVDGDYWVAACRFLRRKNLAEAVLLHRWLRPEGWLITTAGVSSAAEAGYARALEAAARAGEWRVRFSVLAGDEMSADTGQRPTVEELIGSAEAVVMTSVQEGFGLPYLEAAAGGKPLVARRLPNVMPDLEGWGFRFPQSYEEVWVAAEFVDLEAEAERQKKIYAEWRARLPEEVRGFTEAPRWLNGPAVEDLESVSGPTPRRRDGNKQELTPRVAFGRLSLAGQLGVLAVEPGVSWAASAGLNPGIAGWTGELRVTPWPDGVERTLGVSAYAQRFWESMNAPPTRGPAGREIQRRMIEERLGAGYLFPILME